MERLAILDHASHRLYVEDVRDEDLARYNGEEEDYIKDNYNFEEGFSWDYITDALYIPSFDTNPDADCIEIDFDDIADGVFDDMDY